MSHGNCIHGDVGHENGYGAGRVQVYLQQDRLGIAARCKRNKEIRDSYNDNNLFDAQLPLFDYNFNDDVAESELPTNYPNEKPKG